MIKEHLWQELLLPVSIFIVWALFFFVSLYMLISTYTIQVDIRGIVVKSWPLPWGRRAITRQEIAEIFVDENSAGLPEDLRPVGQSAYVDLTCQTKRKQRISLLQLQGTQQLFSELQQKMIVLLKF